MYEQLESRRCLTVGFIAHDILISDVDEVGTRAITQVDIDGDGDLDILSAAAEAVGGEGKVALYRNLGQLRFEPQQVLIEEPAIFVVGADVDSDGHTDVVATTLSGMVWIRNLGGGNFEEPAVIADVFAATIVAADVDADGDTDLVARGTLGNLTLLRNGGAGSFELLEINRNRNTALHAADIDSDGTMEILVGRSDGRIEVYESIVSDELPVEVVAASESADVSSIRTADLDGDGDIDVLAAIQDRLVVIRNQSGTLVNDREFNVLGGISLLDVGDIDRDGDADVFIVGERQGSMFWYENTDGMQTFPETVTSFVGGGFQRGLLMFVADLNSDGWLEVISGGSLNPISPFGGLGFQELVDRQTFEFGHWQRIATQSDGATDAVWADLDGDGFDDLLAVSLFDDRIFWHENLSPGEFGPQQLIDSQLNARSLQANDFDMDGDVDFVVASRVGLLYYENDGVDFVPVVIHDRQSFNVLAGDYDNDGDVDLLQSITIGDSDNPTIQVSIVPNEFGSGEGSWGNSRTVVSHTALSEFRTETAPQFIDFDNDGDADVVQYRANDVAIYENVGETFIPLERIVLPDGESLSGAQSSSIPLRVVDFDNDGDPDLIQDSLNPWWFENIENTGEFTPRRIERIEILSPSGFPLFENSEKSRYIDVDHDGDLDLVAFDYSSFDASFFETRREETLVLFENIDSVYGEPKRLTAVTGSQGGFAQFLDRDIDGDGDTDLSLIHI